MFDIYCFHSNLPCGSLNFLSEKYAQVGEVTAVPWESWLCKFSSVWQRPALGMQLCEMLSILQTSFDHPSCNTKIMLLLETPALGFWPCSPHSHHRWCLPHVSRASSLLFLPFSSLPSHFLPDRAALQAFGNWRGGVIADTRWVIANAFLLFSPLPSEFDVGNFYCSYLSENIGTGAFSPRLANLWSVLPRDFANFSPNGNRTFCLLLPVRGLLNRAVLSPLCDERFNRVFFSTLV